jgi:hypothetical protein
VRPIDEATGSFGVAVTARPDGTFIAVGRAGPDPAAWTSPDGIAWTRVRVDRSSIERERMTAIVATSNVVIAGGSAGPELGDRHAIFWRSPDGVAWTPVADDPGFDGAEVASIVVSGAGFVALGHLGTGQRSTGTIAWRSPDGEHWERIDSPELGGGIAVALVSTRSGLLAVGSDGDEREAVAWSSPDGLIWTRAPQEPSRLYFGQKVRMTDVAVTAAGFVGVGNYVGVQFGTGTSWLSTDGVHWIQAPDQPTFGQAEPEAVIVWNNRLIIVGSRGAPDNYIPSVWLSPDLP